MGLTRGVPAAMMAKITAGNFHPLAMVYLDWPGSAVRLHSGVGDLSYDGKTWLGVGQFGTIEVPAETASLAASTATLTLLGVPPEIFERLDDPIRNRAGEILFGLTTEPGGRVLVSDPVSLFSGVMDAMRYTIQPEGKDLIHAMHLDLGSGPRVRAKASIVHSPEDQKRKYPADTCGRHLLNLEAYTTTMTWPE